MSKKLFYYGSTTSFQNLYSNNYDGVNEYVTLGDNAAFSFTNGAGVDSPFSFTSWVKPDVVDGNLRMVMSKYNATTNVAEYWLFLFSGGIRFQLYGSGSALIRMGTWYFVVGTYSGSEATTGVKIYLGTVAGAASQVDTADSTAGAYTGMSNTTTPLLFGAAIQTVGSAFLFDGRQYHNALWNKELSLAEINEIRTIKGGDLRNASCAANLVEAWHYPTGTGDYPTLKGYKAGLNGVMTNQEAADINVDIP